MSANALMGRNAWLCRGKAQYERMHVQQAGGGCCDKVILYGRRRVAR